MDDQGWRLPSQATRGNAPDSPSATWTGAGTRRDCLSGLLACTAASSPEADGMPAAQADKQRQRRRQRGRAQREKERMEVEEMEAEERSLNASIAHLVDQAQLLQLLGLHSLRETFPTFAQEYEDGQAALAQAQQALLQAVHAGDPWPKPLSPLCETAIGCLQRLSDLRRQVIRSGAARWDLHDAVVCDSGQSMFEAMVGQLPMHTWMKAFMNLEHAWLPPDARALCEQFLRSWKAYESHLDEARRRAIESLYHAGIQKVTASLSHRVRARGDTFVLVPLQNADGGAAEPAPAAAAVDAIDALSGTIDIAAASAQLSKFNPAESDVVAAAIESATQGGCAPSWDNDPATGGSSFNRLEDLSTGRTNGPSSGTDGATGTSASTNMPLAPDALTTVMLSNEAFRVHAVRNLQARVAPKVCAMFLLSAQALTAPAEQLLALLNAPDSQSEDTLPAVQPAPQPPGDAAQ